VIRPDSRQGRGGVAADRRRRKLRLWLGHTVAPFCACTIVA
jgi:hypothetical protein